MKTLTLKELITKKEHKESLIKEIYQKIINSLKKDVNEKVKPVNIINMLKYAALHERILIDIKLLIQYLNIGLDVSTIKKLFNSKNNHYKNIYMLGQLEKTRLVNLKHIQKLLDESTEKKEKSIINKMFNKQINLTKQINSTEKQIKRIKNNLLIFNTKTTIKTNVLELKKLNENLKIN